MWGFIGLGEGDLRRCAVFADLVCLALGGNGALIAVSDIARGGCNPRRVEPGREPGIYLLRVSHWGSDLRLITWKQLAVWCSSSSAYAVY